MICSGQRNYKPPTIEEIKAARKKRVVIHMLTVYGDESYDNGSKRVFAVSGVIGTQEQWDELSQLWLDRTGGVPFHATDCQSGYGVYKKLGMTKEERDLLYKDLVHLIVQSPLRGFGTAMDVGAYKTIFDGTPRNTPYIRCFMDVITFAAALTQSYPGHDVEFIFDMNLGVQYNATELYYIYCEYWKCDLRNRLGTISFGLSKNSVGLQVADLWAYEIMKQWDNTCYNSDKLPMRKSMEALYDSARFTFFGYNNDYFEKHKTNVEQEQFDYAIWMTQKGIESDNVGTRNKYVKYLNQVHRRKSKRSLPD